MAEHWLSGRSDVEKTVHDAASLSQLIDLGTIVYDLSREHFDPPQYPKD